MVTHRAGVTIKKKSKMTPKIFIVIIHTILLAHTVSAQVPFVKSVSKASAGSQETISIQGINFGTNASNIKVAFGGTNATPVTISDQLIEVKVPSASTFDNISVINTSTGLAGYTKAPFFLSYGGTSPFSAVQLSAQSDFFAESGLYDLTVADFDGDGKADVATSNDNSTNISVFQNMSTPGSVLFTKTAWAPGAGTLHVASGDLNGDGKPEIVVTEKNGSRVFIFKNNSTPGTISFTPQNFAISGSKVSQVRIADLDLNGKPDLVVTDQSGGRAFIVSNQSTLASIQFAPATAITTKGTSTDGIAVEDMDGDNFPEIVVCEFLTPTGVISMFKNLSAPGNISFDASLDTQVSTTVSNLKIGDLDGDGKPDLVATGLLVSSIMVFSNQTTPAGLKLGNPVLFDCNDKPWGIDFGDMDGDGKLDIVVSSVTLKNVTVLNNQSTNNFNFTKQSIPVTFINRHPRVGDIDKDGRPDLIFTSIDDQNLGVPASKISVILNLNCVVPKLTPTGPLTVCSGTPERITASDNLGATYQWIKDGSTFGSPVTSPFLDVTTTGTYAVTLNNSSCSKTSSTVQVNVVAGSSLPAATPNSVPPVCIGGTLALSLATDVGGSDYVWSGPSGFSAHGLSVNRTNFQSVQAGKYSVDVMVGTCVQQTVSVVVDVVDVPGVTVDYSGSDIICAGQTKLYTVFPQPANFTYQWSSLAGGDVAGATSSTFTATTSGKYFVKLKSTLNASCAAIQSPDKKIRIAQNPIVDFSAPSSACVSQTVNFLDQSTVDIDPEDTEVDYTWDFGDSATGLTKDGSHDFASAQTFNVKHSVSYRNKSCLASKTIAFLVQSAPSVAITTPSSAFGFCPGDSLQLQVPGNFTSYSWSTGSAAPSIYVKQEGNISVDVTTVSCKVTATKSITQFTAPLVNASVFRSPIKAGDTTRLLATGLTTFLWKPNNNILSDSLIANPIASPKTTTTFTVSGKDVNGCVGSASVDLVIVPEKALNGLKASQFFSPNADGINDVWLVDNAPNLNQCGVAIYDEHGFKVFEAKPYLNNWDGTSTQGKALPAGVYYYIFRCDDSSGYSGGSINIIR